MHLSEKERKLYGLVDQIVKVGDETRERLYRARIKKLYLWFAVLAVLILLLGLCGCWSAPLSLRDLCQVQEKVLTKYVQAADASIQADPKISDKDKASWNEVGLKLLRNQGTITRFVSKAKKGHGE